MTTMTRFVPFRSSFNDIAALQDRLNTIFGEFVPAGETSAEASSVSTMGSFVPAVDVYEDAHALVLKLEVRAFARRISMFGSSTRT